MRKRQASKRRQRKEYQPPEIKRPFVCWKSNKRGYRSKLDALTVAARAAKTGKQRAYKCPHCGFWHLTRRA